MFMDMLILPILIFIVSLMGIIMNSSNILLILINMELMFLSMTLNLLISSFLLNSMSGQILALFIISLAAVESAMGLSLMITFYKIKGSISVNLMNLLKS